MTIPIPETLVTALAGCIDELAEHIDDERLARAHRSALAVMLSCTGGEITAKGLRELDALVQELDLLCDRPELQAAYEAASNALMDVPAHWRSAILSAPAAVVHEDVQERAKALLRAKAEFSRRMVAFGESVTAHCVKCRNATLPLYSTERCATCATGGKSGWLPVLTQLTHEQAQQDPPEGLFARREVAA